MMHDLAYGAKGLQYFTYSAAIWLEGLINRQGERTDAWQIARRVNHGIHTWAPTPRKLTSIAVYHTGPVWSGTRALRPDATQHLGVDCEGDPVTIGFFHNPPEDAVSAHREQKPLRMVEGHAEAQTRYERGDRRDQPGHR